MCDYYTIIFNICVLILVAIYILYVMKCVFNTHGVHMPKHIVSGLKYLTAVELIQRGIQSKRGCSNFRNGQINGFTLFKR